MRKVILTLALLGFHLTGTSTFTAQAADKHAIDVVQQGHEHACADYFILNNQTYCSEKPLAPIPALNAAPKNETWNLHFDNRKWQLGWWNENTQQPMLEYTLSTVHNWTELVTSQYFPGLQARLTPAEFMNAMIGQLKKQGYQPKVSIIAQTPDNVLYEWALTNAGHDNQVEIQRVFRGKTGLHVLHYASRPSMTAEHRKIWIQLLSKATAK